MIREAGHAEGAADWLGLAAAPVFGAMALATAAFGEARPALLCMAGPGAPPALAGMAPMYLLMCAAHLGPWLRRFAGRA